MVRKSLSASSFACLCVDEADPKQDQARLYSCYFNAPLLIRDIGRLPIEYDTLLESLHFPEPSTISRSFSIKQKRTAKRGLEKLMSEEAVKDQKGKKATFMIHILHKQNACWQGKIFWMEKKQYKNFRSTLELLKLIDSALEEESDTKINLQIDQIRS